MSEQILLQILAEVKDLRTDVNGIKADITNMKADITTIKAQLDENTQIIKVIRDRQEETDAKLENLTMDVHHMRGDLTALTETVASIQDELAFTTHKAYTTEKELFNFRRHSLESKIS